VALTELILQQGNGIPTSPDAVIAQYGDALVSVVVTVLIFILAFLVIYRIGKSVLVRVTRRTLDTRGFSPAVISLASSVAGAIALFGAVATAAVVAGFPTILSAFATIAGALALGVAFAAGDIIENFVAGIFILKDEPFEVGDYIEWSGNAGTVREINLRVSKLDTQDNELVTVPNSDLANAVVTNPVANDTRRITFDFGIEYDATVDSAREMIIEEAEKTDGVLTEPAPSAPVTGLADSAVILNGRVWINPKETSAPGVRFAWVEAVKKRFDAEGVGMPYPYTELTGSIEVTSPEDTDTGAVADD